jgi:hypothetical protein
MITAIIGVRQVGVSLSDWLGIIAASLTVLGILIGLIGMYFHWAVVNAAPRRKWIERLRTPRWRDSYHDLLRSALDGLDQRIGPPPLAREHPHGRRVFGATSLGVCIILSLAYTIASWLVGWVAGAPAALGRVTLNAHWLLSWAPDWLLRLAIIFVFALAGILYFLFIVLAGSWYGGDRVRHARGYFVAVAVALLIAISIAAVVAGAGAVAVQLALAGTGDVAVVAARSFAISFSLTFSLNFTLTFAVVKIGPLVGAGAVGIASAVGAALLFEGDASQYALIWLLFLLALPWLNGFLDWISLSASRWFGRGIVAERDSPRTSSLDAGACLGGCHPGSCIRLRRCLAAGLHNPDVGGLGRRSASPIFDSERAEAGGFAR